MKSYLILVVAVAVVGCSLLPAAAIAGTWTRTFEGPEYGAFFDACLTRQGNVLVAGATNHRHVPPYSGDALLMELTLDGDVVWEATWGGDGYEQAWALAPADDGYFVFGETDSYGAGDRDFFLVRIQADGSAQWFRTYGHPQREWPYGMLPLANGDLLLYGFTTVADGVTRRQYAVRVAPDGEPIWEYVRGEAAEELVLDALETEDGTLLLCVNIDEDGGLVMLDPSGTLLWSHRFELDGWQYASEVVPTESGYLLAGFSMSTSPRRQADIWLASCTVGGDLVWETTLGDPTSDDYAQAVLPLGDGTYLIGALGSGMPLVCIDGQGTQLWRVDLADARVHVVRDLIQLDDGGFLVSGLIQISNGRSYDAILVRTDAQGHAE